MTEVGGAGWEEAEGGGGGAEDRGGGQGTERGAHPTTTEVAVNYHVHSSLVHRATNTFRPSGAGFRVGIMLAISGREKIIDYYGLN